MNYRNSIYESEYRITGVDARYPLPHHDDIIEIIQTWSDGGHFIVKNNIEIQKGYPFVWSNFEFQKKSRRFII